MFKKKTVRRQVGKRTGGARPAKEIVSHPPQIDGLEVRHSVTLRFRATAANNLAVFTFQNLLDTMLVATTATTGFDLFQAVRVRRVRVWAVPVIGGSASVSVEFAGSTTGVVGDQSIHSDTSMGIQPAHVDARPSVRSLASDYQVSSASVAFNIQHPAGAVIDVELSFRGNTFGIAATAAQNALVGATAGVVYLRGLDGLATATSNYVPEFVNGQI